MSAAAPIRRAWLDDVHASAALQALAVAIATIAVGALHWHNDGLWFQGDAPRHAMNGVFLWDLLTTLPADPLGFAVSYYARYPVIAPLAYPPFFYLLEGAAFGAAGVSPYVAKTLVLSSAVAAGIYVMAWARRWIAPEAGWAGACTVLLPGFILYSNAILLNVPATALGLGVLYHLRAWLDTENTRHRNLFVALTVAMALTYFPGLVALPVGIVWMLREDRRAPARTLWALLALLLLLIVAAMSLLPAHLVRNAPSIARFLNPSNWMFYSEALWENCGGPWVILGACGMLAAWVTHTRRSEAARLALAFPVVIGCLVALPPRDARYLLLLGPFTVLAAFIGFMVCAEKLRLPRAALSGALAFALTLAAWSAQGTVVQTVSGFEQVASYLRSRAPRDAVLYSGRYDGVFGFYVRALDPGFERRVVQSHRLLYRYELTTDYKWIDTPYVTSASDAVTLIRTRSGCRWVAVEIGPESTLTQADSELHRALEGPEFEMVRSFPVVAGHTVRVDLYRFLPPLEAAPAVDLVFPSFSSRVFSAVEPIRSRH